MVNYETQEELVKAMDEAEARLRAKYQKDGVDDLTWRLTQVSVHIDVMLMKSSECRYHALFEAIEHAADDEARDMALMLMKACLWADDMRSKGFPVGFPLD